MYNDVLNCHIRDIVELTAISKSIMSLSDTMLYLKYEIIENFDTWEMDNCVEDMEYQDG